MHAVFRPSQDGESENPRTNETLGLPCRGSAFLWLSFFGKTKKVTRRQAEALAVASSENANGKATSMDPRLREDDEKKTSLWLSFFGKTKKVTRRQAEALAVASSEKRRAKQRPWIPAYARMTSKSKIKGTGGRRGAGVASAG